MQTNRALTNRIYVLIGLPGSGKTSWRQKILDACKGDYCPVAISSDDSIEREAKRTGETFNQVFDTTYHDEMLDDIITWTRKHIDDGRDLIIDRTNLTIASRQRFLQLVPPSYQKIGIVFSIPKPILVQRLEARNKDGHKVIPTSVLRDMEKRYEPIHRGEFDRYTTIDETCQFI